MKFFFKLKNFYQISCKKNLELEGNMKDFVFIQTVVFNQNNQIEKISDGKKKIEEILGFKEEENMKITKLLKEKEEKNSKLQKEINIYKEINNKFKNEEKIQDFAILQNKLQSAEKKGADFRKDLNYYKELYE